MLLLERNATVRAAALPEHRHFRPVIPLLYGDLYSLRVGVPHVVMECCHQGLAQSGRDEGDSLIFGLGAFVARYSIQCAFVFADPPNYLNRGFGKIARAVAGVGHGPSLIWVPLVVVLTSRASRFKSSLLDTSSSVPFK